MSQNQPDWRYCTCSHKADDHNPCSLACFLCDCPKWTPDMEKSRAELASQRQKKQIQAFYDGAQR